MVWSTVSLLTIVYSCHLGGLFVDLGVLSLRDDLDLGPFLTKGSQLPRFPPSHPAIIEWRALTVILL